MKSVGMEALYSHSHTVSNVQLVVTLPSLVILVKGVAMSPYTMNMFIMQTIESLPIVRSFLCMLKSANKDLDHCLFTVNQSLFTLDQTLSIDTLNLKQWPTALKPP